MAENKPHLQLLELGVPVLEQPACVGLHLAVESRESVTNLAVYTFEPRRTIASPWQRGVHPSCDTIKRDCRAGGRAIGACEARCKAVSNCYEN